MGSNESSNYINNTSVYDLSGDFHKFFIICNSSLILNKEKNKMKMYTHTCTHRNVFTDNVIIFLDRLGIWECS